jgi:hypothetical protein
VRTDTGCGKIGRSFGKSRGAARMRMGYLKITKGFDYSGLRAASHSGFNPKSGIETGNLPQSLGHKRIEKISTDHFGYASIFSICFCSKFLRHLAGLNFGIRV